MGETDGLGSPWYFNLLLHLLWITVCLGSLWLQVGHVVHCIKKKPIVQVTLVDRAHCDLANVYRLCLVCSLVGNVCLSAEITVPFWPAFALSHLLDFLATLFVLYLSIGIIIQYAHVKLKVTTLFEGLSEDTTHLFIRSILGFLAAVVVGTRCFFGAYSFVFPILLKKKMDIYLDLTVAIMLCLCFVSLAINITLQGLIHLERQRSNLVCGSRPHGVRYNPPTSRYALLSLVLAMVVLSNVAVVLSETFYSTGKELLHGVMCILFPFLVIASSKKIRHSALRRLAERWPCLQNLHKIAKMSKVSPEFVSC